MRISPSLDRIFKHDDGSLPDINVVGLTPEQTVVIYGWLMSQCSIARDPTLWSFALDQDVLIRDVPHPARAFISGAVESFRHCLEGLKIDGIALPELSVSVETEGLSFDYRMGPEWGNAEIRALFELLSRVLVLAPNAAISRTEEGAEAIASPEFAASLKEHALTRES